MPRGCAVQCSASISSFSSTLLTAFSFSFPYFSPSGKLVQIEYALAAVSSGAASVGIKASNGVVLATEKKHKSILYEDHSTYKIEKITDRIGMVYSGMGPDYRLLVRRARKMAQVRTRNDNSRTFV